MGCLFGFTVGDVRTVVEPLVHAAVRSAGRVVYDVPVPRGSENCQFASIADQVGQARPACQPTCDDARRDIAAWLEPRYDELRHFLPGADAAAWARRCQGYADGTRAGDDFTLRGAAGVYGCRICVVGRRGSVWFEPPGGACTEVLTLVYFDATDYRHYSSTRPLATRPPGAVDAAAHDVAGSGALRDWLDDSDDDGPGSLLQSLQHVDEPDGDPLVLRGGLQRSEVDRFFQVLVAVRDSMRSVLRWVQAPVTAPEGRASGRTVQFCGVAYCAPDGVSHQIYGGEHWGRGHTGRYLDTGGGSILGHRTQNSNILVRFLQHHLTTAEAGLEVLGNVFATWDTQCTFTTADTTRLHRVLTQTVLDMDGLPCTCQRFQIVPCVGDDVAGTMRDDDADGAVTDLTLVQSPCAGNWCRPVTAACVVAFRCVGGICRLDADSRVTLERDVMSLMSSHRSTGRTGVRNARGSSRGSSQRTRTDGQGGGGGGV